MVKLKMTMIKKRGRGRPKGSKNKPKVDTRVAVKPAPEKLVLDENEDVGDDVWVPQPGGHDVVDELSQLDGFREYQDAFGGDSLTFGDY